MLVQSDVFSLGGLPSPKLPCDARGQRRMAYENRKDEKNVTTIHEVNEISTTQLKLID